MERVGRTYARSLFEVATERGRLDEIRDQLGAFADALSGNREMLLFFVSPRFTPRQKREGLARAVVGADKEFLNFLMLLVDKNRMPAIFSIRRQLDVMWDKERRILPVDVTSAVALDRGTLDALRARIEGQAGQEVRLTETVDPDVVGGLVLRVGNIVFDASLRMRLERMKRQVIEAV